MGDLVNRVDFNPRVASPLRCDLPLASGTISISTQAGSATQDSNPVNYVDTKQITVSPQADMQATLADFPATPAAGATVNVTATCTNAGPSAAVDATCVIAGLPPGATTTCTPNTLPIALAVCASIVCAVSYVTPQNGTFTITATASSTTPDPIASNNIARTVITLVSPVPLVPWWVLFGMLALMGAVTVRRVATPDSHARR